MQPVAPPPLVVALGVGVAPVAPRGAAPLLCGALRRGRRADLLLGLEPIELGRSLVAPGAETGGVDLEGAGADALLVAGIAGGIVRVAVVLHRVQWWRAGLSAA